MTNPFDDPDGNYTVLVNSARAHSLWPAGIPAPSGWSTAFGPSDRAACLAYVNESWRVPDPSPASTNSASTERTPLSSNLALFTIFDQGDTHGAFGPRHLVILGWRLAGQLDLETFARALDDVVVRHEMLRTSVVRDDGPAYQKVHPPGSPRIEVIDLPRDDPRPRDQIVDDFINQVEASTLSVRELPHLRAVIGRLDDQDSVLVLVTHHIASDGWSMHVIISDLAHRYAARRGFEVPDLPPMRQYGDYAVWQAAELASARADQSRAFWRDGYRGAEILDIRADHRVAAGDVAVYSVLRFGIDAELTAAANQFARATRSSLFMVLLSAFNLLLHQLTGAVDLVSTTITSGRVDPSFNETVGPFFNLVPLRTDLSGCRNFIDLSRQVRQTCLDAYAHELPFSEIVAQTPELTKTYERDDGAVCAFQLLQYPGMTEPVTIGDIGYAEVRDRTMGRGRTSDIPNGVLWGLDVLPEGLISGTVRFNSRQFDEPTMAAMIDSFRHLLRRVLADPSSPLPVSLAGKG
jgi:condensation enzyme